MGFFSGMGFLEKVAFAVLSPVVLPLATVIATYEKVVEGKPFFDSDDDGKQSEKNARERIEREAKERQAAQERIAICAYAKDGLAALQTIHSISVKPIPASLSFVELRAAIQTDKLPLDILGLWMPHLLTGDAASLASQEIESLLGEIGNLEKLRQAVIDLQVEGINA